MQSSGKILVVEDGDRWRNLICRLLEKEGYNVDMASNLKEARDLLKENLYHLAILDIQLSDNDKGNQDGMVLLEDMRKSGYLRSLKVIMFSVLDDTKHYRDSFAKYGVLDFQDKNLFSNRGFIEKIRDVFEHQIKVNPKLSINWQSKSADQAVINLRLFNNKIQVKNNSEIKMLIAEELNDLLRRLFYKNDSLIVTPLKPGMSGTNVLKVQAFRAGIGGTSPAIVKFGDSEIIKREQENFDTYVRHQASTRHTTILDVEYTPRLGGIAYQLLGAADEHLESLSDFYEKAGSTEISHILQDLFYETCHSGYKNPGFEHPVNVGRYYKDSMAISRERLEGRLSALKAKRDGDGFLYFNELGADERFVDPLNALDECDKTFPTYECVTHGDLNATNILVDEDNHTWLIDFGATGVGHILRDLAELDSVIRFQLLGSDANLAERLDFERKLSSIRSFNAEGLSQVNLNTSNANLLKAFQTILHLYAIVGNLLPNKHTNLNEYHLTLLFYSLNTIRFSNLELIQRQHALMCAGVLFTRLREKGLYG